MADNFFKIYEALSGGVDSDDIIESAVTGEFWAEVRTSSSSGVGMATPGHSIPPMYPSLQGHKLREAALAVSSWNLEEASLALAAVNAFYNTSERMKALDCYLPIEIYSTVGIDFAGKTVGIIGHMRGPDEMWKTAKAIYRTERAPQTGDYPDAACDLFLPQCDIVLITGSSMINKTLPHLLDLCANAYTVLTGPSVPLCPALLDCGIDRLAGMVITDRDGLSAHVRNNVDGSPYKFSLPFMLEK